MAKELLESILSAEKEAEAIRAEGTAREKTLLADAEKAGADLLTATAAECDRLIAARKEAAEKKAAALLETARREGNAEAAVIRGKAEKNESAAVKTVLDALKAM